ncbi:hypothetical protein ACF0H5_017337 [Mactra antiquata]
MGEIAECYPNKPQYRKSSSWNLKLALHENIYRGLLRSLLHPLGAPDLTVGLRPGDLLDHLKEVFDVQRDDHELYILEELPNRPKNMQVNIVILEANGLRGVDFSEDTCDTFCLLTLHNTAKGRVSGSSSPKCLTPKVSPKNSQRVSPASTPPCSPRQYPKNPHNLLASHQSLLGTKNYSLDADVFSTSTISRSSHPKWNEEFTLDIEDYLTDEIHIFVCDESIQHDTKQEKHSSLKGFLNMLRHSQDSDNCSSLGCLGKITIPVREISALGTDDWYDILAVHSKGKPRAIGKCHLKMGLCNKQACEDSFTSEDYYQAYKQFLQYTCKNAEKNPSRHIGEAYGSLSLKDHRILKMFAEAHRISKLSQAIVNVICLLELQCEDGATDISEVNPHIALDNLRMTWATMQIGQKTLLDRMPLTDIEISNYRKVATKYIHMKSDIVLELPELFPPTVENLNIIKTKLGVIVQLLSLDLWEAKCEPKDVISEKLCKQLHDNAHTWMNHEVDNIVETSSEIKDKVLPEMERLIALVETICSHLTVLPVLKQFYTCLSVNYYRIVCIAVERKLSIICMSIMEKLNKYKKRYNSFPVNILMACKLSLRLYSSLRKLYSVIRENATRRDMFRLTIFHYQEWFEESMVYWLQTFRSECIQRLEKALEIEKDVVVVTSLLKYSHSSVDVLSCFAQVIEEWKKIDYKDPDCCLMGVTNITDIVCDGARLYADKIQSILERNGYYDDKSNSEFDVNERLCITLNNIEHVRMYLSELPLLLSWDTVVTMMSARYDNDKIGTQAAGTLQRLVDLSNEEILMKSAILLRQICEKMRIDIERYTEKFTRKEPNKDSSVDQFLGYLANNLETLNHQLMPDLYPYMNEQLWDVVLQALHKQLLVGEHGDYYDQMKRHLQSVSLFFSRVGLEEKKRHSELYKDLKLRLDLNSNNSHELMRMYYNKLATDMVTPTECYGHLAFKAAYMEETRGNINIYISILRGTDLPGLDPTGYSDPYVEVSLQPHGMFGFSRTQKTHVVKQTLNPVFNVTFQFPNVPKEYLRTPGTCILLSVFDHDTIGRDDYAGEVIVHIPSILKLGVDKSMDKMPAVILPLKRPTKPTDGPFVVYECFISLFLISI